MVELPLEGVTYPKLAGRVRWGVALREMLRKRALTAGKASTPISLLSTVDITCTMLSLHIRTDRVCP